MLTALAILKKFYGPVAVIVAACLAWLLFRAGLTNIELQSSLKKARAELTSTHGKLVEAETAFADLIRDYNSQAREADAREAALERDREATIQKHRSDYATRTAQLDRSLQLALDSLRHAATENGRLALQPAADSPAACAGYAADPTRLSVSHAEFLVREADRANRVAVQGILCQRYVDEVVPREPK